MLSPAGAATANTTVPSTSPSTADSACVTTGRWHVIVATVRHHANAVALFVDGRWVGDAALATTDDATSTVLRAAGNGGLCLGERIVLLGGGKQSESRGGDVRKVRVIDGHLSPDQVAVLTHALRSENPLLRTAAVTIQAAARRRLARVRCAKEQGVEVSELPGAKSLRRQAELLANMNYDDY